MSAISPQSILDQDKFRTIKTQNIVILNDDEIDGLTLSLFNQSSRIPLWISVSNLGQIDINANEELKIFDDVNGVHFQVPLNNPVQSFSSYATGPMGFDNTLKAEVTTTGQRSQVLGPWLIVFYYT